MLANRLLLFLVHFSAKNTERLFRLFVFYMIISGDSVRLPSR